MTPEEEKEYLELVNEKVAELKNDEENIDKSEKELTKMAIDSLESYENVYEEEKLAPREKIPKIIFKDNLMKADLQKTTKREFKTIVNDIIMANVFDPTNVTKFYFLDNIRKKEKKIEEIAPELFNYNEKEGKYTVNSFLKYLDSTEEDIKKIEDIGKLLEIIEGYSIVKNVMTSGNKNKIKFLKKSLQVNLLTNIEYGENNKYLSETYIEKINKSLNKRLDELKEEKEKKPIEEKIIKEEKKETTEPKEENKGIIEFK